MNEEEDFLQKTRQGFEDLCRALNMDEEASNEAWKSYENISKNYTLEGSELHWLACALYVACRTAIPTVGKGTAEGNYVSLTRILSCSEQSLIEFFNKMKKWQDMASLPQEFCQSTEKLERNFTISAVIFKKYIPIFKAIFKAPSDDPPRVHRSRKQRRHPCTVAEVFNFCWILFVNAKGNFPMISDDLVNSYHLLLCALDLVFSNALLCNTRKELLNPNFKGLPEDFNSKDYKPTAGPYCFIEQLCELHDGLVLEAKGVKEHFWKPFIKRLFHKKILKGKEDSLTGFFDPMNFGDSFASMGRVYEEHVLATGGLDERIFLGEGANEDIGTPGPCLCVGVKNQDASALKVSTPLTGLKYVQDNCLGTPVSTAMQSVGRLHSLLTGLKHRPSGRLTDLLRACARDPSETISTRLKDMCQVYCQHFEGKGEENAGLGKDIAVKYFRLAEALYYKTLEAVIDQEKERLGDTDLSVSPTCAALQYVTFSPFCLCVFVHACFRACVHAYLCNISQVIEVLVRAEQGLFREVVKHLNQVEEQVLESLAWRGGSPLWDSVREAKNQPPACQEVGHPQHPSLSPPYSSRAHTNSGVSPSPTTLLDRYSSPPTGSARRRLFVDASFDTPSDPSSTTTTTTVRTSQAIVTTTIPAGQTVVTMATATVTANNGQTVTIPVQGIANENGGITFIPVQVSVTGQGTAMLQPLSAQSLTGTLTSQPQTTTTLNSPAPQGSPATSKPIKKLAAQVLSTNKPQKKGSLSLFFRKVYHMASVRLRDLCAKLDISSELRRKIWTCFEYSLVQCTELMMDRHLDQLLMCAVYVMTKVTKEDKSFQNIMKCYRSQPQASSSVSTVSRALCNDTQTLSWTSSALPRSISPLPHSLPPSGSGDSSPVPMCSTSTLPASQPGSIPSTPTLEGGVVGEEERGDLIHFYNRVYIKQMRHFALRYSPSSPSAGSPPLCPYPSLRTSSPRRVLLSHNHSIYISPHKTTGSPPTPSTTARDKIFYYICSSPSNRLAEINSMIRTGETPTKKRSMQLEEEPSPKRVCPDNQTALLRRLQDVANDRSSSH
uniref:Retinoblastoma-like 2 (p130) n=1 Tax=Oncorhynchus tshawytscha TaxID=74940 RepID=A0A8C8M3I4_ONCTS